MLESLLEPPLNPYKPPIKANKTIKAHKFLHKPIHNPQIRTLGGFLIWGYPQINHFGVSPFMENFTSC